MFIYYKFSFPLYLMALFLNCLLFQKVTLITCAGGSVLYNFTVHLTEVLNKDLPFTFTNFFTLLTDVILILLFAFISTLLYFG